MVNSEYALNVLSLIGTCKEKNTLVESYIANDLFDNDRSNTAISNIQEETALIESSLMLIKQQLSSLSTEMDSFFTNLLASRRDKKMMIIERENKFVAAPNTLLSFYDQSNPLQDISFRGDSGDDEPVNEEAINPLRLLDLVTISSVKNPALYSMSEIIKHLEVSNNVISRVMNLNLTIFNSANVSINKTALSNNTNVRDGVVSNDAMACIANLANSLTAIATLKDRFHYALAENSRIFENMYDFVNKIYHIAIALDTNNDLYDSAVQAYISGSQDTFDYAPESSIVLL